MTLALNKGQSKLRSDRWYRFESSKKKDCGLPALPLWFQQQLEPAARTCSLPNFRIVNADLVVRRAPIPIPIEATALPTQAAVRGRDGQRLVARSGQSYSAASFTIDGDENGERHLRGRTAAEP
jgi:hypothetical protein